MVVQFATARAPDAIASSSRAFSRRSSALSASAILPSAAEKFIPCYVLCYSNKSSSSSCGSFFLSNQQMYPRVLYSLEIGRNQMLM